MATAVAGAALLAGCSSSSSPQLTATVKAPARVAVPPVIGNDVTVATALLKKRRFRWQVQRRYSGQPSGRVIAANPNGGALVAPGTEIALVVSRGAQPQPAAAPTPAPSGSSPGSSAPSAPPSSSSNGGTPSVNSRQGQHALHNSPDCQHAPPPPPGYTGPVQC